ncbi:MAG: hypothetical protein HGB12_06260 [Bacteroidetes bacterium]|nr:hypothetical protein [Bacteroidota bacterium]
MTREHIIVCQFDENLLGRLHKKRLVVNTSADANIPHICQFVNNNQNNLHCIVIHQNNTLASTPFHENWRGIPIAVFADQMGSFKEIMQKMRLIRDLNIRIFLNTDFKENFTNIHILASLGIDCGVFFGENNLDWEALNDLMTYSVYSKAHHATIEPFHFIINNYNPTRTTDFSSVYFNNPYTYLHIDSEENIAITKNDLIEGKYIASGINLIPDISENEKYKEALHSWQEFFLQENGCAFCQAWRVCMGKFSTSIKDNPGCSKFFVDMMEAADYFLSVQHKNKRKELWQP